MTAPARSLTWPGSLGAPVQPWARAAAWAAFLCALPPVAWRGAMLAGAPTGFAEAAEFRADPLLTWYVVGLMVVETAAAALCLGLARPWGERVPAWVPGVGGRTIHRLVPTILGGAGAAVLVAVIGVLGVSFGGAWLGLTDAWTPDAGMTGPQRLVLALCYAPMVLWPEALTVAVIGYWRRRSRPVR